MLGPGTLLLDFDGIVKDLPGDDFAVRTFNLWGPLAGVTRAEFWLNGKLQSSVEKTLGPSKLFTFDLASVSMNQVRLVNMSVDAGVKNQATMYFMDAAVTNLTPTPATPEPTAILLLGTGVVALALRKRHPAAPGV